MKLAELEPEFILWPERTRESATIGNASGVMFACPCGCGSSLVCWMPHVPQTQEPTGGRWRISGTGICDLSLHPSVHCKSTCGAHFFIDQGRVEMVG